MGSTSEGFILLLFICLSAFFSGVETAFVSISDIRVQHLFEQNRRGIPLVRRLKSNYQRLIITILIGNNLVNIAATSIATAMAIDFFQSHAIGIAVGGMTLVILVFGEIFPKTIAMAYNEAIAVRAAPVIRLLQLALYPVIRLLELFMHAISLPLAKAETDPIITEAEIKSVVSMGEEAGEVEKDERIMIHNIFRFTELEANEIMVDRTHMFSIDARESVRSVAPEIVRQGYSRIPVYDGNPDQMVGILYAKDVLQAILEGGEDRPVKDLARPAMFIPESTLTDDLLREFQKEKVHIALVVDEHGGISGLITIEDLLEEIVGDIYDETDTEEILIRRVDKSTAIVQGETEIEAVNDALGLGLSEREDYETISGLILSRLRRIPDVGEELELPNCSIRVTKADPQRIIEVAITQTSESPAPARDEVAGDSAGQ